MGYIIINFIIDFKRLCVRRNIIAFQGNVFWMYACYVLYCIKLLNIVAFLIDCFTYLMLCDLFNVLLS